VRIFLLSAVLLLLFSQANAEDQNVQDILLSATAKLVKDVEALKKRVAELEREVQSLKEKQTLACTCGQKFREQRKIIIGTFKRENRARLFASVFQKRTRYRTEIKTSNCKRLGKCYVVYFSGTPEDLLAVRKLGYRDAFIAAKTF
jgi:uncharacterized protein YhaN